jgi:ABC-2 type transport system permease protein
MEWNSVLRFCTEYRRRRVSISSTTAASLNSLSSGPVRAPITTPSWYATTVVPVLSLAQRELQRFFRQRSRLAGALAQPLVFWLLFGAGFQGSFSVASGNGSMSFQEYFLPGAAMMIVLFASIFSTISVIQDRNEGFLQGVLVSPIPRSSFVLGKLLGGTALAVLQATLFLLMAPLLQFVGLAPSMNWTLGPLQVAGVALFLAVTAFGLTGFGFLFAWKLDSIQGFHAIMSVVMMPMWLVSGAFFPAPASGWLRTVILLNPLSYGLAGVRRIMNPDAAWPNLPSLGTSLVVSLGFGALCLALATWMTRRARA